MEKSDESFQGRIEGATSLESLICDFLEKDSPRYLEQAKELLNVGVLNIRSGKVLIKYKISGDLFCYQYNDQFDGSLQESEILAPELYEDQIAILKFIFAQSEAEVNL